ncbi:MAG: DMT family transporter, partial [Parcubacteria group bacterium]|nr:DMT family transporter [Parcubacteria group bacterium]
MNWLLLSIGTTVLWGISVVLIKKSYFSLSPVMGILTGAAAAVAILLPFAAFNQARFVFWPLTPVAFVVVLSYMFFYYALQKDKVTLTAIMQSTHPLWTVLFASLFLDEQTSLAAKSGVLVIVAVVILLSIERPGDFKRVKAGPWFWWAGTAALLAGFGDFLAKAMILEYDSYSFLLSFVAAWVTAALLIAFLDRKNITAPAFDRNSLYLVV